MHLIIFIAYIGTCTYLTQQPTTTVDLQQIAASRQRLQPAYMGIVIHCSLTKRCFS